MGRVRRHVRPGITNQDGLAIDRVLGEKFPASILEFANLRRVNDAILAVGPIKSPLVRLRIVRTQRQPFDVAGRALCLERVQLRPAIPKLVADSGAV